MWEPAVSGMEKAHNCADLSYRRIRRYSVWRLKRLEARDFSRVRIKFLIHVLMEKGKPKLAIRYAKRLIKDGQGKTPTEIAPGTKVYELVEELAKYLPDEKKINFI